MPVHFLTSLFFPCQCDAFPSATAVTEASHSLPPQGRLWVLWVLLSHRRAQKRCLTLCCKLGCLRSPRPGLLSLSTCLFHRKCVWFLWNLMQAVSTVPSKSTFVCKLTMFLRISLESCSLYLLTQPLVQYHGSTLAMGAAIAHMKNVFL